MKKMKNVLAQRKEAQEAELDLSKSDAEEGNSQFQLEGCGFQFAQVVHEFEPPVAKTYDPRGEAVTLATTVTGNQEGFSERQIKGAEKARTLHATLCYPSQEDFRWIIESKQIKNCPVTVQDVDVAFKIWGKNIAASPVKTIRSKSNPVVRDSVKVPEESLELHNVPVAIELARREKVENVVEELSRTSEKFSEQDSDRSHTTKRLSEMLPI